MRGRVKNEIEAALGRPPWFNSRDFEISATSQQDNSTKLVIKFRYNNEYWFRGVLPIEREKEYASARYKISCAMAPGEINNFETFTVKDKAEFLDAIKIWVSILASELEGIPERRELEEQRAKLEDLLKSTSEMADTFFSKEEADSMMVRLQDLEEQMKRQLEEAAKSKEEADIKIKVLREEFEVLKASLGYMTKKNWAKSAMVKVFEWMKDPTNRKLLKSGADAARILLGEGPTPPTSSS